MVQVSNVHYAEILIWPLKMTYNEKPGLFLSLVVTRKMAPLIAEIIVTLLECNFVFIFTLC